VSRRLPWAQAEENARTRRLLRKLSALEQGGEGGQGIGGELEAGRAKFDAAERHIKATLHTIDSLLGHAPKVCVCVYVCVFERERARAAPPSRAGGSSETVGGSTGESTCRIVEGSLRVR